MSKEKFIEQINYSPKFETKRTFESNYVSESVNVVKDFAIDIRREFDTFDFSSLSPTIATYSYVPGARVMETLSKYTDAIASIKGLIGKGASVQRSMSSLDIEANNTSQNEFIYMCDNIIEETTNIGNLYKECVYGNDSISIEEMYNQDLDVLINAQSLENETDTGKINYLSFFTESSVNSLISAYCSNMDYRVTSFLYSPTEIGSESSNVDNEILSRLFDKYAKDISDLSKKNNDCMYNIGIALKNVFIALSQYEDFLEHDFVKTFEMSDADLFRKAEKEYTLPISQSLTSLMKTLDMSVDIKADILERMNEIVQIRKYYYN